MLPGQMMDRPLLVSAIIDYAAETSPDIEIVSATVEGGIHRYGYRAARERIARLANALLAEGVKPGDRVATLAWNGYRHLELYYAIAGIGAVCHTINPRLFPDQLTFIVNHAGDRHLFLDLTFAPLVEKLRPSLPAGLKLWALCGREHMPRSGLADLGCYEELLASGRPEITWPDLDENAACALCYTSGTTGEPKGVLYSNRAMVLHALFVIAACTRTFQPGRRILPVVPLFHANAWGLPYCAPIAGCALVFPGPRLDGASGFKLLDEEQVTASWGVPTVWLGVLDEMRRQGRKPAALETVLTGGSAAPLPMIEAFERDFGVDIVHGWGMTELSPVGTVTRLGPAESILPFDKWLELKSRQGRRMFGVEMKIVDADGRRLPHDGTAVGELFVRGPAVVKGYFNNPEAGAKAIDAEGWFGTGDVARITPDGFLVIVDRTKDLVKSGGEWISSIDVENIAIGAPGIANCALIGVPHPKWSERPLLVAVKAPGAEATRQSVIDFLSGRIARWQLPDDVVFVEALPMTATGKISKKDLRARFASYTLPGA